MRRPAPSVQISPRLLKHFAAVTLVITVCVAMFASGGSAQISSELQDREARNQLLKTEADTLGSRKVAATLKRDHPPGRGQWGNDGGLDDGSGQGAMDPDSAGTDGNDDRAAWSSPAAGTTFTPGITPGNSIKVNGKPVLVRPGQPFPRSADASRAQAEQPFRPDASQIDAIRAAARERTGSSSGDD